MTISILHRARRAVVLFGVALVFAWPGAAQARVYWSVGIGMPVYYGSGWYPGGWNEGWWGVPYAPYGGWSTWNPPVVIEREPMVLQALPPGPAPQSFWYYCQNPAGYYPYVANCPGGWTPVPATPPPPRPSPAK